MINYIYFQRNCSSLMESDSPCSQKERRHYIFNGFPLGCCDHNDTIVCHVQLLLGRKPNCPPLRSKGKSQTRSLPLFFIILILTWQDLSSRATCDSMIQPSNVVLAHELVKPNVPVIENYEPQSFGCMRGMISVVRLKSIVDPTVIMQLKLCCVLLASRSVIDRTLVAANGKGRNLPILYYDFDGADCFSRTSCSYVPSLCTEDEGEKKMRKKMLMT